MSKFIIAFKIDCQVRFENDVIILGEDWQSFAEAESMNEAEQKMNLCTEDESRLMIAVFRKRQNWQDYKPMRLRDFRDKSDWPIRNLEGLINSLDSSWF